MVTRLTDYTKQFWSLLSTDDTDSLTPHNGDEAVLIDRDERYVFDEENQTWRQIPMSGGGGGGETYFTNPSTGCIYPRVLNQTLVGFNSLRYGSYRWAGCVNMEEATVAGLVDVTGGRNSNPFTGCVALKRLALPSFSNTGTYVANGCTALEQAQLGSVGHAVTALSPYTFDGDTQAGLTITIYVADNAALPLANSPWGAANATIIYRSSTTGEVLA